MDEMSSERERLDKGWMLILLIWVAILSTLGIYIFVCYLVKIPQENLTVAPELVDRMKYILMGVSVVEIFVIQFVRKLAMKVRGGEMAGDSGGTQHPAVAKYFAATLVSAALAESIAIYGVVIYFMSGDIVSLYPFVIVAAAAMLYFRPRKEELLAIAAEM